MDAVAAKQTQHVTVIGVGLLGGSVGLALKARNPGVRIAGVGRRQASLDAALEVGAIDTAHLDLAEVDGAAELLLLVEHSNQRIMEALRDGIDIRAALWQTIEKQLQQASAGIVQLAEQVEQRLRHAPEVPLIYESLAAGSGTYSNAEDFSQGLTMAARLGFDLNQLFIGRYPGTDVVRVIRGRAQGTDDINQASPAEAENGGR